MTPALFMSTSIFLPLRVLFHFQQRPNNMGLRYGARMSANLSRAPSCLVGERLLHVSFSDLHKGEGGIRQFLGFRADFIPVIQPWTLNKIISESKEYHHFWTLRSKQVPRALCALTCGLHAREVPKTDNHVDSSPRHVRNKSQIRMHSWWQNRPLIFKRK